MMIKNVAKNVVPAVTVMFAGLLGAYMVYQGFYSDNITAVTISQYEPAAGDEMVVDTNADDMMSIEMDHSHMGDDHVMESDMEGGMDWELSADESAMTEEAMDTDMMAEETMTTEEMATEETMTEDMAEEAVAVEDTGSMDAEIMTDEVGTDMASESGAEMEAETDMQAAIEEETVAPSDMMMEEDGELAPATIEPAAE